MERTNGQHTHADPAVMMSNKDDSHPRKHRLLIGLVLLLMVIPNAYSWVMTSQGLTETRLIPLDTWAVTGPQMVMGITLVMQIVIYLFWARLPFVRLRTAILTGVLFILTLTFMIISITFSAFSITKNAEGDGITASRRSRVVAFQNEIRAISEDISSAYALKLESYSAQAEKARRGEDETGIAECGSICKGYLRKRNHAEDRYGLLSRAVKPSVAGEDVQGQWVDTQGAYQSLERRLDLVSEFDADSLLDPLGLDVKAIRFRLQNVGEQLTRMLDEGGQISEDKLVLMTVMQRFWMAVEYPTGADVGIWLVLLLACLPDLMSLTLALTVRILLKSEDDGDDLRPEIRTRRLRLKNEKTLARLDEKIRDLALVRRFREAFAGRFEQSEDEH